MSLNWPTSAHFSTLCVTRLTFTLKHTVFRDGFLPVPPTIERNQLFIDLGGFTTLTDGLEVRVFVKVGGG